MFKKAIFPLLLLLLLYGCGETPHRFTQTFQSVPEKPTPANEVTVYYNPSGTELEGVESIDLVAYIYSRDVDDAISVNMQREGDGWKGSFTPPENARGALIIFSSGNQLWDRNNKKGYTLFMHNENGNPLPGAYAGLANGYNGWATYYAGTDKDEDEIKNLIEKDFQQNPEIKREYMNLYLSLAVKDNAAAIDSIVAAELGTIEAAENLTEYDVEVLANWYGRIKNTEKAASYKSMITERFPNSDFAQLERYRAFQNETDPARKNELLTEYESAYPKGKYVANMYDIIANSYVEQKDYEGLKDFLSRNKDKMTVYRFYVISNNLQKDVAVPKELVSSILDIGIERGRAEVSNPTSIRQKFQTMKEWKESREYVLGLNLFAKGKLLTADENYSAALPYLEEAALLTRNENSDINELYSLSLFEMNENDKALLLVEERLEKGEATAPMKEVHKNAYSKKHGSLDGYDNYISRFESAAKENLHEKVTKEMIDLPAPDFMLTDLNGKQVSLAEHKGKTVVIDFWATWCGPCLNSFPGMQKSVNKLNSNPNIKFLFVNSWERVEDKKKNATEFIKKNNYTFHVLLDDKNEVIAKYKVDGIPTKFVVDPNGRIRFKSVGFSGNVDQMIEELELMIELASKPKS